MSPTNDRGTARTRTRPTRRRVKISQIVAAEIVREIVERELREGDRLPTEAEMLEEFDVGRASIREALRILEGFGLISVRQGQNGGPVVASLQPADLGRALSLYFHMMGATYGDLIEARLIIEPVMARLAAERQHPEHMGHLREHMEAEQQASLEDPEYIRHADEFHFIVSGMSGNKVLDIIGRSLRALFQERVRFGAVLPADSRPQTRKVHRQIGDAILAGNGRRAAKLMEDHLRELAEATEARQPTLYTDRITWED